MSIQGTAFIVDTPLGTAFIVDTPALEELYIASLDEMDKIALNVARTTMGSLFSLSKSTAFIEWINVEALPSGAASNPLKKGGRLFINNERNKKQLDA